MMKVKKQLSPTVCVTHSASIHFLPHNPLTQWAAIAFLSTPVRVLDRGEDNEPPKSPQGFQAAGRI